MGFRCHARICAADTGGSTNVMSAPQPACCQSLPIKHVWRGMTSNRGRAHMTRNRGRAHMNETQAEHTETAA